MKDIEKIDLIERYFEGKLSKKENSFFDSLLKKDLDFAETVEDYRQITLFTENLEEKALLEDLDMDMDVLSIEEREKLDEVFNNTSEIHYDTVIRPILRKQVFEHRYAAAISILLLSLGAFVFMLFNVESDRSKLAVEQKQPIDFQLRYEKRTHSTPKNFQASHESTTSKNPRISNRPQQKSEYLAENFQSSTDFERLIQESARGTQDDISRRNPENVRILEPQTNGMIFSQSISFEWETPMEEGEYTIEIFTNQEVLVKSKIVKANKNKLTFNVKGFTPGLYYWKLMYNDEDLHHTGKFLIK